MTNTDEATDEARREASRTQWHLEHEDSDGLELCVDCTGLLANGEYNEDAGAWESVEALTDAIDKKWPEAEGWHIEYAGCTDPDDDDTPEDDARYHINFTWSACDGCGSTLGGSRCQGYAWRVRPHVWQRARFTGVETCERCHLLPLDADDDATPCVVAE